MFFKNPLLLYALLLLIIPILVHLFHLQKFETVKFTNVRLLQQIEKQTRKSSRLKKWLLLITRLLLLTSPDPGFCTTLFSKKRHKKKCHNFYLSRQ
ncbi:MAG: BatA domain-containing protein [Flavobacteriaceae bacterium]|nr:BatA domain-containing protein [Flavobacteriaceae bacterium]